MVFIFMEKELLKIYLGSKYNYFITNKFNEYNFLLPIVYMIYKGMLIYSAIWIILIIILINIFYENLVLLFISILLLNLFISFNFNSLYIDFIQDNIKKILKKKNFDEAKVEIEYISTPSYLFINLIVKIITFIIVFVICGLLGGFGFIFLLLGNPISLLFGFIMIIIWIITIIKNNKF